MQRKPLNKVELLAPAGDLNRAKTAIRYGADAVYIGGKQFSLRSRASNFTLEDIQEACAYAGENNAKIYVTVNEIPHTEDFEGLEAYLKQLESFGVSAIIVASPAIMRLAKKVTANLEVHCSTQMNITNSATVRFLKENVGIDRVVLARECDMSTIADIVNHCGIETEVFIHGGMCVNYSGRCTLSNRMTLRDANRGGCAQSCRWSYRLYNHGEPVLATQAYTMGSKDLCAVNSIREMMEIGVSSFKIEGRMKTEYYVASVVSAYRHLIDELYALQGQMSKERMEYHSREIHKAENRETYNGFFDGNRQESTLITHENTNADVNHDFVAVIEGMEDEHHAWMITRNVVQKEDCIEVLSPRKENRIFTMPVMIGEKGERISDCRNPMKRLLIEVPFEVQKGDILRKADL